MYRDTWKDTFGITISFNAVPLSKVLISVCLGTNGQECCDTFGIFLTLLTITLIIGILGKTLLVLQFQVQLEVKQPQYHVTREVQLQ